VARKTTRDQERSEPLEALALDGATAERIEEFAEDLGRLLGTARAKAEGWLGQRQAIAKQLIGIRDTATELLSQLGHSDSPSSAGRRGRRRSGAEATMSLAEFQPQPGQRRKRRRLSAKGRAAISAAQKARWARHKAKANK
jgi:hypothetical protein